ncbi:MAG: asparaginase [Rhodoferax sp.]|nr:asparaginase [Rhodoferax sp.]
MSKKIVFLGTGGTIAGTAASAVDNVGYTAAQLNVDQLLVCIPALPDTLGECTAVFEQVMQIDSKDMGWPQWLALVRRVCHYLTMPDVAAIVVTHGTDTLEETAFFLSQVLPRDGLACKSVVLTCAMRPASSLAADGPQNLLDAVVVARSQAAHGVLVVCAGGVHAAHAVQKVHPYRLNAFDSGDAAALAYVEEGAVRWVQRCPQSDRNTAFTPELLERWSQGPWPRVEIVMNYVGATGATVRALCVEPSDSSPAVQGIVVAGTGNGTLHHDLEAALWQAQRQGVKVVRATRCPQGCVVPGAGSDAALPHAQGLSAVKARIALMLDIMATMATSLKTARHHPP